MRSRQFALLAGILLLIQACAPALAGSDMQRTPGEMTIAVGASPTVRPADTNAPIEASPAGTDTPLAATIAPGASHLTTPSDSPALGKLIYDVESSGTASEKRAPYGDSYKIDRFERPFLQDMTYVPDMDIVSYNVSSDSGWYYVSIELVGKDPNNSLGIDYGVEVDLDADGFGDYLIWAGPPYTTEWSTEPVQVFADKNHDTGGISAERSDAPTTGDGYETRIFSGRSQDPDPDLAWVRINAGPNATVQFAFKKSLADAAFMLGVISDAGLKDAGKMDYNDRFTEQEAGSPERKEADYPLKALYAVDTVCREGIGFRPTGDEPQSCPLDQGPTSKPVKTPETCPPPAGCKVWDPVACVCTG